MQAYLPIWMQKSWGKFTTFGGGGYWINPGTGNKNWIYAGWEAQYDINKTFSPGCEIFYNSQAQQVQILHIMQVLQATSLSLASMPAASSTSPSEFHFIFTVVTPSPVKAQPLLT